MDGKQSSNQPITSIISKLVGSSVTVVPGTEVQKYGNDDAPTRARRATLRVPRVPGSLDAAVVVVVDVVVAAAAVDVVVAAFAVFSLGRAGLAAPLARRRAGLTAAALLAGRRAELAAALLLELVDLHLAQATELPLLATCGLLTAPSGCLFMHGLLVQRPFPSPSNLQQRCNLRLQRHFPSTRFEQLTIVALPVLAAQVFLHLVLTLDLRDFISLLLQRTMQRNTTRV